MVEVMTKAMMEVTRNTHTDPVIMAMFFSSLL